MEKQVFMAQLEELKADIKAQLKQVKNHGYVNAKLYDAFFVNNQESLNEFYRFCEDEWEWFKEFLNENDLDTKQLGRTSSFLIVSDNYSDPNDYNEYEDLTELSESELDKVVIQFMDSELFFVKRENDKLSFADIDGLVNHFMQKHGSDLEETFDTIKEYLEYIQNDLIELELYVKELPSINEAYEYLEKFKEHQVYNYMYFIQNHLEENYIDGFLSDYIRLDYAKEKYPEQYDMFLKEFSFTHEQLVNEPQVAQLNEELDDTRNELKELEAKLNQDSILVAHDLIKGATPYEGIRKLTQLVNIFQQKHSELVVLENELMSQLLELKGE
jgi:hypothetical protein